MQGSIHLDFHLQLSSWDSFSSKSGRRISFLKIRDYLVSANPTEHMKRQGVSSIYRGQVTYDST